MNDDGSVTVKLSKPVKAHGEDIGEITMRKPIVDDIMDLGQPFLLMIDEVAGTGVRVQPKMVAQYVVRLGKVPMSTVKSLELHDFNALQSAVMDFFGAGAADQ